MAGWYANFDDTSHAKDLTVGSRIVMSTTTRISSVATLKQLSYRITSTPVEQLPRLVPQIANTLWTCKDVLSASTAATKQGADEGVAVNRFRTQLTSLLSERTVEGRWSAVVLVKATIEAGGLEILSKANGWVKNLLGFLKKPDPVSTKNLAVITLTRIFMLTWDHQNLVREITTPALPAFISTCLSNAQHKQCVASELQTILEAFITLIPRHPTLFRTHEAHIRALLNRIISSTASHVGPQHYTQAHIANAQRLLLLFHHCAPKQGSADKWDETFKTTVDAAHATCDRIFRALVEDRRPMTGVRPSLPAQQLLAGDLEQEGEDLTGLSGWKGMLAGSERLIALLGMLQAHLDTATASTVTVRIGMLTDLTTRLMNVTRPVTGRPDFIKPNQQVSRDEREALFTALPAIHMAALHLIAAIFDRFGTSIMGVIPQFIEQLIWVFQAEKNDDRVRTAAYTVVRHMLVLVGQTLESHEVSELTPVVTGCCNDLLPPDEDASQQPINVAMQSQPVPMSRSVSRGNAVPIAASALLPVLLSQLKPNCLSRKLRSQMDRTAILTKHKDALVASILNPSLNASGSQRQPSLVPFLARLFPGDPQVEAILRPRMPFITSGKRKSAVEDEEEEEEEDEEDGEQGEGLDEVQDEEEAMKDEAMHDAVSGAPAEQAEPDLLDALDAHLGTSDQKPTDQTGNGTSKRAAPATEPESSAKRFRPSPVAETLLAETKQDVQDLPGPDPITAQAGVPVTLRESSGNTATVRSSAPMVPNSSLGSGADGGDDDDGSDFEMPPLTMEPSDDEEDEEDE